MRFQKITKTKLKRQNIKERKKNLNIYQDILLFNTIETTKKVLEKNKKNAGNINNLFYRIF